MAGIVILTDIIAPNTLWEAGVTGRQIRRNRRAENQAGVMNINVVWENTKREYTWGTVPQTVAVWQTLEGLWEETDAGAYGFLLQDPKDPSASHDTGTATLISAPAHTYQASKSYPVAGSSRTHTRTIKYLRSSDFELKIAGVVKTVNVDYTFDDTTGIITIPSDPAASDVTWSGTYYIPVHFRDDELEWQLVIAGTEAQRRVTGPRVVICEVKQ